MTISSQTLCFEAHCKCEVGFIHTQLASSHAKAPQKLASSPSTVGFIARDFHVLISRQRSQTDIKISVYAKHQLCRFPTYHTKRAVLAIPDEANFSWLHQSHHCEHGDQYKHDTRVVSSIPHVFGKSKLLVPILDLHNLVLPFSHRRTACV